jgi:hypothetical protein
LRPTAADFVLEQLAQRLDQLHPHPLGQAADVVVALDQRRLPDDRDRLDDVGIERALREKVDLPELRRLLSKTSMNVAPMILRFFSGSVTPARRSRNSVDASTNTSGSCSRSKRLRICAASSEPQHAVVDEDAGQLSPIARWMMSAATVESTPPLSAQTTRPSPTCARTRAVASSTNDAIVQSPVQPQTPYAKLRRISRPRLGVDDFRVEQQRVERALESAIAAIGALALVATTEKPAGA